MLSYRYGNQQYVHYKVNCPANHSAFLEIIEMDLEAENCFDPNDNITKLERYKLILITFFC